MRYEDEAVRGVLPYERVEFGGDRLRGADEAGASPRLDQGPRTSGGPRIDTGPPVDTGPRVGTGRRWHPKPGAGERGGLVLGLGRGVAEDDADTGHDLQVVRCPAVL